jgi:enoyl-CoA hydratase/carnithine racemase
MSSSLVETERRGHIEFVTLNHPERRNALSTAMLQALGDALQRAGADAEVRVVVLRAVGPVFSSGHDLRELVGCPEAAAAKLFALCSEVMESIRLLRLPVIAQVQGLATAAGCQLVASCDLAVASEDARFATPGVKIGLFCTTPAVALVRAVPPRAAMEMLLLGDPIDAQTALRQGLVNRVVPRDQLEQVVAAMASQIAAAAPEVVALGKRTFYQQLPLDHCQAYALAGPVMSANAVLPAAQEGMRAFLEKRPPRWPG